jgi:4-hydroxyphenylpyruvate dioxygenase-like putative hemolysin
MKDALYDIGKTHIQITEPLDPTSAIGQHLATHGPGVYHVAWGVDNIQKVAQELAAKGNKMRGKDGITESPRGYLTSNIDPASSHGLWFQLAEG